MAISLVNLSFGRFVRSCSPEVIANRIGLDRLEHIYNSPLTRLAWGLTRHGTASDPVRYQLPECMAVPFLMQYGFQKMHPNLVSVKLLPTRAVSYILMFLHSIVEDVWEEYKSSSTAKNDFLIHLAKFYFEKNRVSIGSTESMMAPTQPGPSVAGSKRTRPRRKPVLLGQEDEDIRMVQADAVMEEYKMVVATARVLFESDVVVDPSLLQHDKRHDWNF
jgi:hypothetical protein